MTATDKLLEWADKLETALDQPDTDKVWRTAREVAEDIRAVLQQDGAPEITDDPDSPLVPEPDPEYHS